MTESYDERYARAVRNANAAPAWQDTFDPTQDASPELADPPERPRQFWIVLFLTLSLLACVLGAVFIPGGMGFIAGYQQLQAQDHELAIQHFNRGLGYLADNYPELAYAEFQIAVKYDSSYAPAQQQLSALQAKLGGQGTPGAQPEDRVAATLFQQASDLVKQKQWSDAITRLEQLQTLKPDYNKAQVSSMLYQADVASGTQAVAAGQIELARERFDAALAIQGGDAAVTRQRDLAQLYLDGQQAAGYDWQTAIQKFSALYQQDSNYFDAKKRLIDAYTQYGDLAGKQNAWCLAVSEYDKALAITQDASLADKRVQAMTLCKQAISATPTPAVGGQNYTSSKPVAANLPCTGIGDVSGVVRDALGNPLAGVAVGYYADGIPLIATRTNANGQYQLVWGKDPGLFHVAVLEADGKTPASPVVDVNYPGGNAAGCHVLIDWQKVQ